MAYEQNSVTGSSTDPDVVRIGAGIMSATLAVILKELDPKLKIEICGVVDSAALESSNAWNRESWDTEARRRNFAHHPMPRNYSARRRRTGTPMLCRTRVAVEPRNRSAKKRCPWVLIATRSQPFSFTHLMISSAGSP
jgi:Malate:quinone oxidoreductase (Mqo)